MAVIRSSNAEQAIEDGSRPAPVDFDIKRYVRPSRTPQAWDFLTGYAQAFERQNADTGAREDDPTFRIAGGQEADADAVLDAFVKCFVLRELSAAQRRSLWALAKSRSLQIGPPVVFASPESPSLYDPTCIHVFFAGVPEARRGAFREVAAAKALKPEECEVICLVLLPDPEHLWEGSDGRMRLSMWDDTASDLLGLIAPMRAIEAETWYELVKGAVRHLWTQANPPRPRGRKPLDELDEAEYASLLATGEHEPF